MEVPRHKRLSRERVQGPGTPDRDGNLIVNGKIFDPMTGEARSQTARELSEFMMVEKEGKKSLQTTVEHYYIEKGMMVEVFDDIPHGSLLFLGRAAEQIENSEIVETEEALGLFAASFLMEPQLVIDSH